MPWRTLRPKPSYGQAESQSLSEEMHYHIQHGSIARQLRSNTALKTIWPIISWFMASEDPWGTKPGWRCFYPVKPRPSTRAFFADVEITYPNGVRVRLTPENFEHISRLIRLVWICLAWPQHWTIICIIHPPICDGFNGLSGLIQNRMQRNPLSESVHIYQQASYHMKLLHWEYGGFISTIRPGKWHLEVAAVTVMEHTVGLLQSWWLMVEGISLKHVVKRKRYLLTAFCWY